MFFDIRRRICYAYWVKVTKITLENNTLTTTTGTITDPDLAAVNRNTKPSGLYFQV